MANTVIKPSCLYCNNPCLVDNDCMVWVTLHSIFSHFAV